MYEKNDGQFPDESAVEIWYPPAGAVDHQRDTWAWLPGSVIGQCGPNEWHVVVEVREMATLEDGTPAPMELTDVNLYYPTAFRDATELRRA